MSNQEAAQLSEHYGNVIKAHKARHSKQSAEWEKDMRMYRGEAWGSNSGGAGSTIPESHAHVAKAQGTTVQYPYSYAFTDVLVSNIVPPNPACDIRARRDVLGDTASIRTQLVNDVFDKDNTTWKLWRAATLASVQPRSAIKAVWSEKRKRPKFRVIPAGRFWFDMNAEEYSDVRYFIEIVPITKGDFESRCKKRGRGTSKKALYKAGTDKDKDISWEKYPSWLDSKDTTGILDDDAATSRDAYKWTVIYEIYDFRTQKLVHMIDGKKEPLLIGELPYPTLKNPFWVISFNDDLLSLGGFSDSSMIREPLDRLNELATLRLEHAKMSLPRMFIHKERIDAPEDLVTALARQTSSRQAVMVETLQKYNISDVIEYTMPPTLSIDWISSMNDIRQLVEFILALPTYARGEVGKADVATELALVDTAQKTRNARRQKVIYQAIEWMAGATLSLFRIYLKEKEEQQIYLRLDDDTTAVASLSSLDLISEDNPWDYDFKAFPYNAAEDNSTVRLKKVEAFLAFLAQDPNVDKRKLAREVLQALNMDHLLGDPAQAAPAPMPGAPGMPPAPGGSPMAAAAGMPQEMADLAGGNLPAGGEDIQAPLPAASGGQMALA
jgi:hypothetical protein